MLARTRKMVRGTTANFQSSRSWGTAAGSRSLPPAVRTEAYGQRRRPEQSKASQLAPSLPSTGMFDDQELRARSVQEGLALPVLAVRRSRGGTRQLDGLH